MSLKRRSLTEQIYEQLKANIIEATYQQGEVLTEAELAKTYKVSKTPIREALNRLSTEGFIEILPHKGYIIKGISFNDLQHLFQFRCILEVAAVELAVNHATGEELKQLESMAIKEFFIDNEESYRRYSELNYDFHVFLAQVSHNPLLAASLSNVLNQLRRVLLPDLKNIQVKEIIKSHLEIVHAIKMQEKETVIRLIKQHIKDSQHRIMTHKVLD